MLTGEKVAFAGMQEKNIDFKKNFKKSFFWGEDNVRFGT